MHHSEFIPTIKQLKLSRKYVLFAILYGLTTLIVPLAVQFLVNNLALAGIWVNIFGFIVIIASGLSISVIMRYCQIILNEFLMRDLFHQHTVNWKKQIERPKRKYFMEVFFGMKTFSKSFTTIVEIALITIFGMMMVISFHPAFLIIAILIGFTLYWINQTTKPAIKSSIRISDEKYHLFDEVQEDSIPSMEKMNKYLQARENRFGFIKKISVKIFVLYIICQLLLLGGGTLMVEASQLSIGQLVSAEIILTNILISMQKLPDALENMYDFETSIYKINKAKEAVHE